MNSNSEVTGWNWTKFWKISLRYESTDCFKFLSQSNMNMMKVATLSSVLVSSVLGVSHSVYS